MHTWTHLHLRKTTVATDFATSRSREKSRKVAKSNIFFAKLTKLRDVLRYFAKSLMSVAKFIAKCRKAAIVTSRSSNCVFAIFRDKLREVFVRLRDYKEFREVLKFVSRKICELRDFVQLRDIAKSVAKSQSPSRSRKVRRNRNFLQTFVNLSRSTAKHRETHFNTSRNSL